MVMNLYILFFVSLPLAILDLAQFLLFAGKKDRLKINSPNVIRFVISVILMLVATCFIRPAASSVPVSMTLHTIVYVIILILVYRINIQYAILGVIFTMLLRSTIENAYFPYIIAFTSKGWANFQQQYLLYPLYTIPDFISSIIVIWFLWKYEFFMITKINKSLHKIFIYTTLVLLSVEYYFLFLFFTYSDKMPLAHQISFSITLLVMATGLNLLIFRLIYKVVIGLVQKGYAQYSDLEDAAKYAFVEIQKMLKEKNYSGASNLIDEIVGKEEQKN